MKRMAVYPGSFDPVTFGHIDLIDRTVGLFDELIIAVARNIHKTGYFTVPERMEMIAELTAKYDNVHVGINGRLDTLQAAI